MFQGLINDAKSAAASFVEKYLARASVAVPFVVAFGFATTAVGLGLSERFGATNAFWMMAAGFSAIGLVAAIVVTMKEQETAAATAEEQEGGESGFGELGEIASAATGAASQLPLGLLASTLASQPGSAMAVVRLLGRNMPLMLLLALVALLVWPIEQPEPPGDEEEGSAAGNDRKDTPKEDPLKEAA